MCIIIRCVLLHMRRIMAVQGSYLPKLNYFICSKPFRFACHSQRYMSKTTSANTLTRYASFRIILEKSTKKIIKKWRRGNLRRTGSAGKTLATFIAVVTRVTVGKGNQCWQQRLTGQHIALRVFVCLKRRAVGVLIMHGLAQSARHSSEGKKWKINIM